MLPQHSGLIRDFSRCYAFWTYLLCLCFVCAMDHCTTACPRLRKMMSIHLVPTLSPQVCKCCLGRQLASQRALAKRQEQELQNSERTQVVPIGPQSFGREQRCILDIQESYSPANPLESISTYGAQNEENRVFVSKFIFSQLFLIKCEKRARNAINYHKLHAKTTQLKTLWDTTPCLAFFVEMQ